MKKVLCKKVLGAMQIFWCPVMVRCYAHTPPYTGGVLQCTSPRWWVTYLHSTSPNCYREAY
jgi:hypothetical protein